MKQGISGIQNKHSKLDFGNMTTLFIMLMAAFIGIYILMTLSYWRIEITNELNLLEMIVHTDVQLARIEVLRWDSLVCHTGILTTLICTIGLVGKGFYEIFRHRRTFKDSKDFIKLGLFTIVVTGVFYNIWF